MEDAIAALDRVPREAFPAQWTYQRAWALLSLGRFDEASGLLDGALKENPVDQGGVIHAARAMLRAKRGDRAARKPTWRRPFASEGRSSTSITRPGCDWGRLRDIGESRESSGSGLRMRPTTDSPTTPILKRMSHLERLRAIPRFRAFLANLRLRNGSTLPENLSDPDPPARGPYFTTCSVTSILSVSPLICGCPVPNRIVWPSRITTVLLGAEGAERGGIRVLQRLRVRIGRIDRRVADADVDRKRFSSSRVANSRCRCRRFCIASSCVVLSVERLRSPAGVVWLSVTVVVPIGTSMPIRMLTGS